MNDIRTKKYKGFMLLALIMISYSLIGCMIIYNVTRGNSNCHHYVQHQALAATFCLSCALALFCMPDKILRLLVLPCCILSYLSLWGLFVFGHKVHGAYGWYRWNTFCLQPAELAKPLFIMALAMLCRKTNGIPSPCKRLLAQLAFAALVILPIALQPDFGTVLIYAITFVVIIWANGMPNKFLVFFAVAGAAISAFAYRHFSHVRLRISSFCESLFLSGPPKDYHGQRLQECIIKGGWTGALLNPFDALNILPFRHNDSMFAGATELLGAAGVIPIVLICMGWHYACCRLAYNETDASHRLIFLGAGTMLTTQAFVHLAVNLGLMPNTGIPMPMLSYGGSSLLSTFLLITLVHRLSVKD